MYYRKKIGEREVHERLIIRPLHGGWYHVCTPDGDIYAEELKVPPLIGLWPLKILNDGSREVPQGFHPDECYFFEDGSAGLAPFTQAHQDMMLSESHAMFAGDMADLGFTVPLRRLGHKGQPPALPLPAPVALKDAPARPATDQRRVQLAPVQVRIEEPPLADGQVTPRSPRPDIGTDGHWVYSKTIGSFSEGCRALVSKSFVMLGLFGVTEPAPGVQVPVQWSSLAVDALELGDLKKDLPGGKTVDDADGPLGRDVRLLDLQKDRRGKIFMTFKDAVDQFEEKYSDEHHTEGPDTVIFCGQYMSSNGGNPLNYHNRFVAEGNLDKCDPHVLEHESLCRIFQTGVEVDQLHGSQLVMFELICRGIQRIQSRFRDCFLGKLDIDAGGGKKGKGRVRAAPDADLHLFLGGSALRGRMCLCPKLMQFIADRKHIEYCQLKEERMLNEERFAMQQGGKVPPDKA